MLYDTITGVKVYLLNGIRTGSRKKPKARVFERPRVPRTALVRGALRFLAQFRGDGMRPRDEVTKLLRARCVPASRDRIRAPGGAVADVSTKIDRPKSSNWLGMPRTEF